MRITHQNFMEKFKCGPQDKADTRSLAFQDPSSDLPLDQKASSAAVSIAPTLIPGLFALLRQKSWGC